MKGSGIMYSTMQSVTSLIVIVVSFVCLWVLFQKAGEKGWKAIIPFYNAYLTYKLFWKKSMFWVALIISVLVTALTMGVYASHLDDMVNITNTAANELGIDADALDRGELNMTEEELNQAAQDYADRMEYELDNGIDNSLANAFIAAFENISSLDVILIVLIFILSIAMFVISILSCVNMSKSFGHGGGYAVGLIFLPIIFLLILAFGKSQYVKRS